MLTQEERLIVREYQSQRIPAIYKIDNTDNILFVEDVDFVVCNSLIKSKKIECSEIERIVKEYSKYLSQISISNFDDDAIYHFKTLNVVMSIFFKYNL